jgi:hypothetical protein
MRMYEDGNPHDPGIEIAAGVFRQPSAAALASGFTTKPPNNDKNIATHTLRHPFFAVSSENIGSPFFR